MHQCWCSTSTVELLSFWILALVCHACPGFAFHPRLPRQVSSLLVGFVFVLIFCFFSACTGPQYLASPRGMVVNIPLLPLKELLNYEKTGRSIERRYQERTKGRNERMQVTKLWYYQYGTTGVGTCHNRRTFHP